MLVICDIDGTIANNEHRAHHVEKKDGTKTTQADWDAFLAPELILLDAPIPGAKERLMELCDKHGAYIVFLTGRNYTIRDATHQWLQQHFAEVMPRAGLIMREATHWKTRATEYKREMVEKLMMSQEFKDFAVVAFEDDKYIWPVFQKLGIMTFKAPECWSVLFPDAGEQPEETTWRR